MFTVRSMSFTEKDRTDIQNFFENTILMKKNIILDLRNNFGGNVEDTYFLYSLFFNKRFRPEKLKKVNRVTYNSFEYSENYCSDVELYEDFIQVDKADGLYKTYESHPEDFIELLPMDKPISADVYVLTNGFTGSAAVQLASFFKYFNRGVIIGEEGCGSFYSMNAVDFAFIRLGETGLLANIPLIQNVNNYNFTENIPMDRGVIPDIQIKESLESLINEEDIVLNFTIDLINTRLRRKNIIIFSIIGSVLIVFFFIHKFRHKIHI